MGKIHKEKSRKSRRSKWPTTCRGQAKLDEEKELDSFLERAELYSPDPWLFSEPLDPEIVHYDNENDEVDYD